MEHWANFIIYTTMLCKKGNYIQRRMAKSQINYSKSTYPVFTFKLYAFHFIPIGGYLKFMSL